VFAVVLSLDMMGEMNLRCLKNTINDGLTMEKSKMRSRGLLLSIILILALNLKAFAQDENLESVLDYKIGKMTRELKLTEPQADGIRPIIKNYIIKHEEILQSIAGQGIVDHVSVKSALKTLKEAEYQKLAKILTEEQMKKWINKENLMATLNPDNSESSLEDDVGLTPSGANFKF